VDHELIYRNRRGEVCSLAHNPAHRWFYLPAMRKTEVMLPECYDLEPNVVRITAHCAFDDPRSPPAAAPRWSIEMLMPAFFESPA